MKYTKPTNTKTDFIIIYTKFTNADKFKRDTIVMLIINQ
jgi:hypothetical protein